MAEKVANLRKQPIIATTMDADHLPFPVENKPLILDNIRRKTTVPLRVQPAHSVELFSKSLNNKNPGSVYLRKHHKRARCELGTLSTHSLPNEVVEEILSRLPVKSLVRFRRVCKSWNHHLSYSERFVSLHLQNYGVSQLLVGTCNLFKVHCSMYFLPPPPSNGGYSDNDVASQKMMKPGFPRLLDGSCNGIVCLYSDRATEDIVLWNPATKESKIIPRSGLPCKQGGISFSAVGFGFDPKTNDYKILRMVSGGLSASIAQMELYSLRKNTWKKVDSHDFYMMRSVDPADVACRLPFADNRIVCTVVSPLSGPSKWELLMFDMSSETYETILMPPSLNDELGGDIDRRYREKYFKVFPFEETVALGIVQRVEKRSYCDIWVLDSFSCTTLSRRCWIKLLSTNINDGCTVPVGCWESRFLFQETLSGKMFRYDRAKNIMVEIGVFQPSCVTTTAYKESLVRLNHHVSRMRVGGKEECQEKMPTGENYGGTANHARAPQALCSIPTLYLPFQNRAPCLCNNL